MLATKGKMQVWQSKLAEVRSIMDFKEKLIDEKLRSTVSIAGSNATVFLAELFSPFSRAVVVIRRNNGSHISYE